METSALEYDLPPELIAQRPAERRDESRLLVYDRRTGDVRHRRFSELPEELAPGELTVVNDTRVIPARLRLRRPGGGEAEVLLLEHVGPDGVWEGLARPSRRLRAGQRLGPVELLEPLGEGEPGEPAPGAGSPAGPGSSNTVLQGRTRLFITPGFEFERVDSLLTNFHLPRSSLLALVMAFAGVEETRRLYDLAIEERYRFYSFGDAMLIR